MTAFKISDVVLDLPSKHCKVHLSGSFVTKIAAPFVKLFKGTILKKVNKTIKDMIPKVVPPALNGLIAK